jgi:hypothetical protein
MPKTPYGKSTLFTRIKVGWSYLRSTMSPGQSEMWSQYQLATSLSRTFKAANLNFDSSLSLMDCIVKKKDAHLQNNIKKKQVQNNYVRRGLNRSQK